jgi:hypothetical protein
MKGYLGKNGELNTGIMGVESIASNIYQEIERFVSGLNSE